MRVVIEAGCGECHPFAGRLDLPDTHMLVYPQRGEGGAVLVRT